MRFDPSIVTVNSCYLSQIVRSPVVIVDVTISLIVRLLMSTVTFAEQHLHTKHQIDWDSATCIMYSSDYYQQLSLESWFTNLEQAPLIRSQQLPAPYKRLIDNIKQNLLQENDWRADNKVWELSKIK